MLSPLFITPHCFKPINLIIRVTPKHLPIPPRIFPGQPPPPIPKLIAQHINHKRGLTITPSKLLKQRHSQRMREFRHTFLLSSEHSLHPSIILYHQCNFRIPVPSLTPVIYIRASHYYSHIVDYHAFTVDIHYFSHWSTK